jgi:hypothetical protein
MLKFRFGGKAARDPAAAEQAKQNVREALSLSADVAISINEISCADPACPILETVILVMEPGRKTRAYKLHGAMQAMSAEQLRHALSA